MERKGAEVYVGLFLLIGLSVIAAMVVTFGKTLPDFACRVGRAIHRRSMVYSNYVLGIALSPPPPDQARRHGRRQNAQTVQFFSRSAVRVRSENRELTGTDRRRSASDEAAWRQA